jgi:hypothetical protein
VTFCVGSRRACAEPGGTQGGRVALKGHEMVAQGSALGAKARKTQALKGREISRRYRMLHLVRDRAALTGLGVVPPVFRGRCLLLCEVAKLLRYEARAGLPYVAPPGLRTEADSKLVSPPSCSSM